VAPLSQHNETKRNPKKRVGIAKCVVDDHVSVTSKLAVVAKKKKTRKVVPATEKGHVVRQNLKRHVWVQQQQSVPRRAATTKAVVGREAVRDVPNHRVSVEPKKKRLLLAEVMSARVTRSSMVTKSRPTIESVALSPSPPPPPSSPPPLAALNVNASRRMRQPPSPLPPPPPKILLTPVVPPASQTRAAAANLSAKSRDRRRRHHRTPSPVKRPSSQPNVPLRLRAEERGVGGNSKAVMGKATAASHGADVAKVGGKIGGKVAPVPKSKFEVGQVGERRKREHDRQRAQREEMKKVAAKRPDFLGSGSYASVLRLDNRAIKHVYMMHTYVQERAAAAIMNGACGIVEFDLPKSSLVQKTLAMRVYARSFREYFRVAREVMGGRCADQMRLDIYALAADVARGLAAIHAKYLVHSDVTPRNLFVALPNRRCGRLRFEARVGDLGILAPIGHARVSFTPAPYREQHVQSDTKHDIFSFGVLLLEILGDDELPSRVHTYNELANLVDDVCRGRPRLHQILSRMLSPRRLSRPSANEIAHFFGELAGSVWSTTTSTSHPQQLDRHNKRVEYVKPTKSVSTNAVLTERELERQYHANYERRVVEAEKRKIDAVRRVAEDALDVETGLYLHIESILLSLAADIRMGGTWHDQVSACLTPLVVLVAAKNAEYKMKQKLASQRLRAPIDETGAPDAIRRIVASPPSIECWCAAALYIIACVYGPEFYQRVDAVEWCGNMAPTHDIGETGFYSALECACDSYPLLAGIFLLPAPSDADDAYAANH
jgi:hypothetical protein